MSAASPTFQKSNFAEDSNIVTNVFLPLTPGTQFVFGGVANRGSGLINHQVIFTVTDLVRSIDGVNCVVVWDRDINNGVLQEAELAFFAQDKQGNVWNLAEYPEEYENGNFVGAPSTWLNGEADARGGVHMLARPLVGTPPYDQGLVPSIDFHDVAQITDAGETLAVGGKTYTNVLVTEEWNPAELPAKQLKFYAPGVGIIEIGHVNDPEGETLQLVAVNHLNSRELQTARYEALKLEDRAYNLNSLYQEADPALRFEPDGFEALLEGTSLSQTLLAHNGRDNVFGYGGDDRLYGLGHDDSLSAGSGNDLLRGGLGIDYLFGGSGADRFEYAYASESRGGTRDMILDFNRAQGDKIDLHLMDANTDVAGNQDFTFIGNAAFSGAAGELRYGTVNGQVVVQGNTDADSDVDFLVRVNGTVPNQVGDFVL
jgi:hypothetical protein